MPQLLSPLHLYRHGFNMRRMSLASFRRTNSAVQSECWSHTKNTVRAMATQAQPTLTIDNLNPCIKVMEYAVRGPLVIRAGEIEKELEKVNLSCFFLDANLRYSSLFRTGTVVYLHRNGMLSSLGLWLLLFLLAFSMAYYNRFGWQFK